MSDEISNLKIRDLIRSYKKDRVSPYRKLRYRTRQNYDSLMKRITTDHCIINDDLVCIGDLRLAVLRRRTFLELHEHWSCDGEHVPMAHSLVAMVRILIGFGVVFLEDRECERIAGLLHKMKFEMGKGRDQFLTTEQIEAIRVRAHKEGYPSVAMANALQFDGTLRQKDIIGEIVPQSEPGLSDVTWNHKKRGAVKWLRGSRWNEIDNNLILRHVTSKKLKLVEIDLKLAPMVLEEFEIAYCDPGERLIIYDDKGGVVAVNRHLLPASGPLIINEDTGRPYETHTFRRRWRLIARAAGVPDEVQNRDTRAGAITEAIESGASLEDARKSAAHSTPLMTAKYSRDFAKATARAMSKRAADRAGKKQRNEDVA